MTKIIYLAGPITGLSYEGATSWRQYAIEKLKPIFGLSPMRGKDYLLDKQCLAAEGYSDTVLSTPKAITARDRFDCQRADLLIINLAGAQRISIGTMIEIGWADSKRIPIILVMERGNVHEHAMVSETCNFIVNTLDEAIDLAKTILIEEVV
jgi:nucleoside 2-deoxyribosyltransferase